MKYNRILEILDSGGRSQTWLVKKIKEKGKSMSPQSMTKYCSNTVQPKVEMLYVIAEILEVEPSDLLVWPIEDDKAA